MILFYLRQSTDIGFTLLCGELRAHFSSVLVRIQAGQKMANIVWEFH
jgi:hypothetical protein